MIRETFYGALRRSPDGRLFLDSRSIALLPAIVENRLTQEKRSAPQVHAMYPVVRIAKLKVSLDEELGDEVDSLY